MDANNEQENEITPPTNEQEKQELDDQMVAGREIFATLKTEGWQKHIEPALRRRRASLSAEILSAKEVGDFIRCQQAVNAIDNLFNFVEGTVKLGEVAMQRLQAEVETKPTTP